MTRRLVITTDATEAIRLMRRGIYQVGEDRVKSFFNYINQVAQKPINDVLEFQSDLCLAMLKDGAILKYWIGKSEVRGCYILELYIDNVYMSVDMYIDIDLIEIRASGDEIPF